MEFIPRVEMARQPDNLGVGNKWKKRTNTNFLLEKLEACLCTFQKIENVPKRQI